MWLIENYQTDFIKEKRFNEKDNFFVVWNFQYRIIYDKIWECLVKVFYKQKFFTTFTYIYWDGTMFPFERKLRFHLEWFNKSFEIKKWLFLPKIMHIKKWFYIWFDCYDENLEKTFSNNDLKYKVSYEKEKVIIDEIVQMWNEDKKLSQYIIDLYWMEKTIDYQQIKINWDNWDKLLEDIKKLPYIPQNWIYTIDSWFEIDWCQGSVISYLKDILEYIKNLSWNNSNSIVTFKQFNKMSYYSHYQTYVHDFDISINVWAENLEKIHEFYDGFSMRFPELVEIHHSREDNPTWNKPHIQDTVSFGIKSKDWRIQNLSKIQKYLRNIQYYYTFDPYQPKLFMYKDENKELLLNIFTNNDELGEKKDILYDILINEDHFLTNKLNKDYIWWKRKIEEEIYLLKNIPILENKYWKDNLFFIYKKWIWFSFLNEQGKVLSFFDFREYELTFIFLEKDCGVEFDIDAECWTILINFWSKYTILFDMLNLTFSKVKNLETKNELLKFKPLWNWQYFINAKFINKPSWDRYQFISTFKKVKWEWVFGYERPTICLKAFSDRKVYSIFQYWLSWITNLVKNQYLQFTNEVEIDDKEVVEYYKYISFKQNNGLFLLYVMNSIYQSHQLSDIRTLTRQNWTIIPNSKQKLLLFLDSSFLKD